MRIIAGRLKGRQFDSPHSRQTHPMGDRVRGALFNTLGDLSDLSVLDPFAGTGALGFEAISRGAASVVMIEMDRPAQKVIERNIAKLELTDVTFIRGNARAWLRRHKAVQFDVVLCDPPYDDIDPLVLRQLVDATKQGGVFVLSWPGKQKVIELEGLALHQQKSYGDAQLIFYYRQ